MLSVEPRDMSFTMTDDFGLPAIYYDEDGTRYGTAAEMIAEIKRLREALLPFANEASNWDGAPDETIPQCYMNFYPEPQHHFADFKVEDLRRAYALVKALW